MAANQMDMKRAKVILHKKDKERLEIIKEYIKNNLDKDLRIEALASEFHMSMSTLQRHFFAYMKQPVHAYVLDCWKEKSKELLRSHTLTINEVSLKVGCKDHSGFTHKFIQNVGCTPLNFIKLNP